MGFWLAEEGVVRSTLGPIYREEGCKPSRPALGVSAENNLSTEALELGIPWAELVLSRTRSVQNALCGNLAAWTTYCSSNQGVVVCFWGVLRINLMVVGYGLGGGCSPFLNFQSEQGLGML